MANTILFYSSSKCHGQINFNNYTKTFDWDKDKYKLDRCTAEVICRTYLDKKGLDDITTKTKNIEPQGLQEKLNEFNADHIQQNFNNTFNEIKEYISKNCDKVLIDIEEAEPISSERLHEIAGNEEERQKFIKRLFEILAIIHDNNLVHRDIKIENLMYVIREKREVLVLNDWDASFLLQNDLPEGLKYILPLATLRYAAPEQISKTYMKIGTHTDIWQAGIVSYYMYNACEFPQLYKDINFEEGDPQEIRRDMDKFFSVLRTTSKSFPKPKNGDDYIKNTILKALSVNPENRLPAKDIIDKIEERTNNPDTHEYENHNYNPWEKAKETSKPIDRKAYDEIIKKREKDERRKKTIAIFSVLFVALTIVGVLNFRNNRTDGEASPTSDTVHVTQEATKPTVQTEQTTAPEESVYIAETVPPPEPTLGNTEIPVGEDIDNFNYKYVEWVENYRLGDGYYTGGFDENGNVHGKGCIYEKDNGEKYEGDYYHGKRHGKGVQTTAEYTYDGYWKDDMMYDDDCTLTYSNGNEYKGGVRNNKMNGQGIFSLKVSDRGYQGKYVGFFVDSNFEGYGLFKFDNGDEFEGEFKQNKLWNGEARYFSTGLVEIIENSKPKE